MLASSFRFRTGRLAGIGVLLALIAAAGCAPDAPAAPTAPRTGARPPSGIARAVGASATLRVRPRGFDSATAPNVLVSPIDEVSGWDGASEIGLAVPDARFSVLVAMRDSNVVALAGVGARELAAGNVILDDTATAIALLEIAPPFSQFGPAFASEFSDSLRTLPEVRALAGVIGAERAAGRAVAPANDAVVDAVAVALQAALGALSRAGAAAPPSTSRAPSVALARPRYDASNIGDSGPSWASANPAWDNWVAVGVAPSRASAGLVVANQFGFRRVAYVVPARPDGTPGHLADLPRARPVELKPAQVTLQVSFAQAGSCLNNLAHQTWKNLCGLGAPSVSTIPIPPDLAASGAAGLLVFGPGPADSTASDAERRLGRRGKLEAVADLLVGYAAPVIGFSDSSRVACIRQLVIDGANARSYGNTLEAWGGPSDLTALAVADALRDVAATAAACFPGTPAGTRARSIGVMTGAAVFGKAAARAANVLDFAFALSGFAVAGLEATSYSTSDRTAFAVSGVWLDHFDFLSVDDTTRPAPRYVSPDSTVGFRLRATYRGRRIARQADVPFLTAADPVAAFGGQGPADFVALRVHAPTTLTANVDGVRGSTQIAPYPTRLVPDASSDRQRGFPTRMLALPLAVRSMGDSTPIAGDSILFEAGGGARLNGCFASDDASCALTRMVVLADREGRAAVNLWLSATPGPSTLTASRLRAGVPTDSVVFSAEGGGHVVVVGGNGQKVAPGTWLPTPLSVRVTDLRDSVVPNASVAFLPDSGVPSYANTDANGVAAVAYRLPSYAAVHRIVAQAQALPTTRARFRATAGVSITPASPAEIDGVPGRALPAPFVARVTDAGGRPLASWAVPAYTTSAGDTTLRYAGTYYTDADGVVAATGYAPRGSWQPGDTAGGIASSFVLRPAYAGPGVQATFRAAGLWTAQVATDAVNTTCPQPPQYQTYPPAMTVTVTVTSGGSPVQGAWVVLNAGTYGQTDGSGNFVACMPRAAQVRPAISF